MVIFKKKHILRRFGEVTYKDGYPMADYTDMILDMDVQTPSDVTEMTEAGADASKSLKVFCDTEILIDDEHTGQRADKLWYKGKWFDCKTSRLAENTFIKHYVATFEECTDQDKEPEVTV